MGSCRGLAKSYGARVAVRDVTIRLLPGEMIGLVGANGGGKTTTLRLLAGLLRPDAGSGTVLGDDVRHPRPGRRRRLGYMSQRLALYPDLSVRENLRFHAALHGFDDRRIAQISGQYGLGDVLGQSFGNLSGGWARRVQFAAATIHAPPLLLLDEPTAGLDMLTRRTIWQWLDGLVRRGHGIVISTHDIAEAAQCTKIAFYNEGRACPLMTPGAMLTQTGAASLEDAMMRLTAARAA